MSRRYGRAGGSILGKDAETRARAACSRVSKKMDEGAQQFQKI